MSGPFGNWGWGGQALLGPQKDACGTATSTGEALAGGRVVLILTSKGSTADLRVMVPPRGVRDWPAGDGRGLPVSSPCS